VPAEGHPHIEATEVPGRVLLDNAVVQAQKEYSVAGNKSREENAMAENESAGGFGWFLAGLGIGALVGVLYAPKSGKETRDDLKAGALDAKDRANELYEQGKSQAVAYAEQGKQVASQYVDKSKQVAAEYVDKGKDYYDKGRTQWSQYVDKGKDLIQTQADAAKAAVEAGKEAYVAKTNESTPVS
jgi:gas vesicle protein